MMHLVPLLTPTTSRGPPDNMAPVADVLALQFGPVAELFPTSGSTQESARFCVIQYRG